MESIESIHLQNLELILSSECSKLPTSALHVLDKIKSTLHYSTATSALSHAQAEKHLKSLNIHWPWNLDTSSVQYTFAYGPPEKIEIINQETLSNSVASALFVTENKCIELHLAVQMPKVLYQPKDHLNHRYFHKRSFYLAHLASELQPLLPSLKNSTMDFIFFKNDPRLPILKLNLPSLGKKGASTKIMFLPCLNPNVISISKLLPHHNNVRPKDASLGLPPTPNYNATLLSTTLLMNHFMYMQEASILVPSLAWCFKLLSVWCRKKTLIDWYYPLSILLSFWAHERRLSKDWNVILIFRNLMFFLSNHNFWSPLPLYGTSTKVDFELSQFQSTNGAAFVDVNGFNLTYWTSVSDIQALSLHSKHALNLLEKNQFEELLKYVPEIHPYDHICMIPTPSKPPAFYNARVRLDYPSLSQYLIFALPKLFHKAFSNRILLSKYLHDPPSVAWPIQASPPVDSLPSLLKFGFLLTPEHDQLLTMGPCPESDPEGAREFRRVWGERAELRRFPDGQILLCAEWPSSMNQFASILDYLLQRHLSVHGVHDHVAPILPLLPTRSSATEVFQSLSKLLTDLPDLPLPIASILPLSSHLTRCALFDDGPAQFCVILEKSERWPKNDPAAFYYMMMMFLIHFSNELEARKIECQLITMPLSLQLEYQQVKFQLSLDVEGKEQSALNHAADMSSFTLTYPSLGTIIRLFKLWIAKHRMTIYIHDAIAELIAIQSLLGSSLQPTFPIDPKWGLMRIFEYISLHSEADWFVKTRDEATFPTEFGSDTSTSMAPTSYLVCSTHIQFCVPAMIMKRLRYLSEAALKSTFMLQMFKPSLSGYDAYLFLNKSPHIDKFIAELLHLYSPHIYLFFNPLEPHLITIAFDPDTLKVRPWRPFLKHPKLVEEDFTVLDRRSVLNEIERLGKGLIHKLDFSPPTS